MDPVRAPDDERANRALNNVKLRPLIYPGQCRRCGCLGTYLTEPEPTGICGMCDYDSSWARDNRMVCELLHRRLRGLPPEATA